MRKKLFRFAIKGDREELLETSSHAFSFPALTPGNYELWVSYGKRNGDWSVPLKLLTVHVVPPLWQRVWFIALMIVVVLIITGWGIRLIMEKKERELAWAMKEHERKFYEEKVRFMVNISHEPVSYTHLFLGKNTKIGKIMYIIF